MAINGHMSGWKKIGPWLLNGSPTSEESASDKTGEIDATPTRKDISQRTQPAPKNKKHISNGQDPSRFSTSQNPSKSKTLITL